MSEEYPEYELMDRCQDDDVSNGRPRGGKIAITFLLIVLFLTYFAIVCVAYFLKKLPHIQKRAKLLMNELGYKHLFFFQFIAIMHVVLPKPIPIIMLYIQGILYGVHIAMHFLRKHLFMIISYVVLNVWLFVCAVILLFDSWCWYFTHRGNFGEGFIFNS